MRLQRPVIERGPGIFHEPPDFFLQLLPLRKLRPRDLPLLGVDLKLEALLLQPAHVPEEPDDDHPLRRAGRLFFEHGLQTPPGLFVQLMLPCQTLRFVDRLATGVVMEWQDTPAARGLRGLLEFFHRDVEQIVAAELREPVEGALNGRRVLSQPVEMGPPRVRVAEHSPPVALRRLAAAPPGGVVPEPRERLAGGKVLQRKAIVEKPCRPSAKRFDLRAQALAGLGIGDDPLGRRRMARGQMRQEDERPGLLEEGAVTSGIERNRGREDVFCRGVPAW